jgi:hypothetical protein
MIDYVKDIVSTWDSKSNVEDLDGFKIYLKRSRGQPTATPLNLFTVDETSMKLSESQKTVFHNIVAKALYLAKCAWPDIAVAIVAFLTTRVHEPDVQDWAKLSHLVEYLRSTIDMPLVLGASSGRVL